MFWQCEMAMTRDEYEAALARIDALMGAAPGSEAGAELNALVALVRAYEGEADDEDEDDLSAEPAGGCMADPTPGQYGWQD